MNHHSPRRKAKAKPASEPAAPPVGDKRRRILDAAVRVFAEEGFYNAKVARIAELAGVADGTIYLYFKSKDDLLISLFEDRMDEVNARLRSVLAEPGSAVERLTRAVKLQFELVRQNQPMAEVISVELRQSSKFIREYANPKFAEYLRLIAGCVADGQTRGELRANLSPQLVARSLFGALDEIALAWLVKGQEKMDLARAGDELASLFVDGMRAQPRKK
jgi:TetR/AcrR family fatty acid metabolism transcriptional regulator